jgi:hypothetical protein
LTAEEKSEKRRKKEEEWKALTERSRDRSRDEAARKAEADRKEDCGRMMNGPQVSIVCVVVDYFFQ